MRIILSRLDVRSNANRATMLERLLERDVDDRRLLPSLRAIVDDPRASARVRAMAMVALMRAEHSDRYLHELVELAAASSRDACRKALDAFSPASSELLLRAGLVLRDASNLGLSPGQTAYLTGFIDLAAMSPDRAESDVRARFRSGPVEELPWLFELAKGVRTGAPDLAAATRRVLDGGDPRTKHDLLRALTHDVEAFGDARTELARLVIASTGELDPPSRALALRAVAALGAFPEDVRRGVLAHASDPRFTDDALEALATLGPTAADATPALIALAADLPAAHRELLGRAVLRTGGDGALDYARERLRTASTEELRVILTEIASVPEADALLPQLGDVVLDAADPAARGLALLAMARLDPDAEADSTAKLIQQHLGASEPEVQAAAVRSAGALHAMPIPIVDALLELSDRDGQGQGREAAERIRALGDRAAGASGLVDTLLTRLQDRRGRAPRSRAALTEAVGRLAPERTAVRSLLSDALRSDELPLRAAALRGLAGVDRPTKDEYVLVARQCGQRGLLGLAKALLHRPGWEAARAQYGVKTTWSR